MELRTGVDPVRVGRVVVGTAAGLAVAGLLAAVLKAQDAAPWNLTRLFDPDQKLNVPTGFKTTALLATALLLLLRGTLARRRGEPRAAGWRWLAAGAGAAFLDETAYVHQSVAEVLEDRPGTTGVLHFAWWLVYLPLALVAGVLAVRFLLGLHRVLRTRLLLGGALYGCGAFAMEPVKSAVASGSGERSLAFATTAAASDALQMVGLALLVVALLRDVLLGVGTVSFVAVRHVRRPRRAVPATVDAATPAAVATAAGATAAPVGDTPPAAPAATGSTAPSGPTPPDAETAVVVTTTDPSPPAVVVLPDGATAAPVRVPDVPETDDKDT